MKFFISIITEYLPGILVCSDIIFIRGGVNSKWKMPRRVWGSETLGWQGTVQGNTVIGVVVEGRELQVVADS